MPSVILACDLGTGGVKTTLFDEAGTSLAGKFVSYETFYPSAGRHEQRPEDWWNAIIKSTGELTSEIPDLVSQVACIALSGQSLGVVPVDSKGVLLREFTPIWSDTRTLRQTQQFFSRIDPEAWYLATGNGFPAECYTLFKTMWFRENEPEMYNQIRWILGSKDYINFKMTGSIATDHSYASGSGAYNLLEGRYDESFFGASGLKENLFPNITGSSEVIGELLPEPASQLGLKPGIPVVCGGVDNSCMALGARNTKDGRVYTSLGSSAWIAVSSSRPVVDAKNRPFVFAHVVPGLYTSAVSIFAAGNSYRWARDVLMPGNQNSYATMDEMASRSPIGSNHLLFNPSLSGGTSQDPNPHIRGGYLGLELRHDRNDMIRSVMEGVAMNLGAVLTILRSYVTLDSEMLVVGGGARSPLWLQIFADVYRMRVVKTNIDLDAGSLGAAALGAVGVGLWKDFSPIDDIHQVESLSDPDPGNVRIYEELMPVFYRIRDGAADVGLQLHTLENKDSIAKKLEDNKK